MIKLVGGSVLLLTFLVVCLFASSFYLFIRSCSLFISLFFSLLCGCTHNIALNCEILLTHSYDVDEESVIRGEGEHVKLLLIKPYS